MKSGWVSRRAVAVGLPVAASVLLTFATSPAALAGTTRTLNLSFSCSTGEPYGLQVNTGSGYYQPSGSSYAVGDVKYFTVTISSTATTLQFMPLSCDNEPSGSGPDPWWNSYTLTPGTSTINASGYCDDFTYNYGGGEPALIFDCSISSLTYG